MRSGSLRPIALLIAGLAILAGATVGMLAGREPFATWYYQLAWYPLLLAVESALRLRTGRWFLLDRPAVTAALLAWSVPFWLFFELLNFRMANWYYVFVPADPVTRWAGITIAFATVLPAIFLAEAALAGVGVGTDTPHPPRSMPPSLPGILQALGLIMVAVALTWPTYLFPLIWGAATLLLDPAVYRRDPSRSLLGDLAAGRYGRILRLLLGGLAIGLIWETFNFGARGKWIYTVPGLEELKLFEMPVAGFLGFPVLALDGWAFWQTLVVSGLAPAGLGPDPLPADPRPGPASAPSTTPRTPFIRRRSRSTLLAAALLAAVFSAAIFRGMERFTISSYSPTVGAIPGVDSAPLLAAGYDPWELADSDPDDVARRADIPPGEARRAVERARLVTLRGIGTENARQLVEIGVPSVRALADRSADELAKQLPGVTADRKTLARIRVWVRAARR